MTSDEIQQYIENSFATDCPRMTSRQNVESDPRIYEGPGTIYQNDSSDTVEGENRVPELCERLRMN